MSELSIAGSFVDHGLEDAASMGSFIVKGDKEPADHPSDAFSYREPEEWEKTIVALNGGRVDEGADLSPFKRLGKERRKIPSAYRVDPEDSPPSPPSLRLKADTSDRRSLPSDWIGAGGADQHASDIVEGSTSTEDDEATIMDLEDLFGQTDTNPGVALGTVPFKDARGKSSATAGDSAAFLLHPAEEADECEASELPIVIFVNPKSGGQQGEAVLCVYQEAFPEGHVYNLLAPKEGGGVEGPDVGLTRWSGKKFRAIAAGGDGTVGWVLQRIDELDIVPLPAVSVLPLGTGNDLSRVLGWGGSYSARAANPVRAAHALSSTHTVKLDRWDVHYAPLTAFNPDLHCSAAADEASSVAEGEREEALQVVPKADGEVPTGQHLVMNNYWSIGVDAEIALDFHNQREATPAYFQSLLVNKGWYGAYGLKSVATYHGPLRTHLRVWVDGCPLELGPTIRAVVVLNLPSYMGGTDMWGIDDATRTDWTTPAIDDGKFEVVGVTGAVHLASIQSGVARGVKLAQGSALRVQVTKALPGQIDGEPTMLIPCDVSIAHRNQTPMLFNLRSGVIKRTVAEQSVEKYARSLDKTLGPQESAASITPIGRRPAKAVSGDSGGAWTRGAILVGAVATLGTAAGLFIWASKRETPFLTIVPNTV